jgi:predicted permease
MNRIGADLRYAVRRLLHNPGFAIVVVATLALGIGVTTAIFSIVQAVLLRPLPYADPDRLVTTFHFYPSLNNLEAGYAVPTYRDLGERTHLFDTYAVMTGGDVTLTDRGQPERLKGVRATADYFRLFGVAPLVGRTFARSEDQPGRDKVVVLSHGLWTRRFGGSRNIIGQRLTLNGEPCEIIGVMPASFREVFARQTEVWTPLAFTPDQFAEDRRTNEFLTMIGRLRAGVTLEQASRDISTFAAQLKRDHRDSYPPEWTIHARALAEQGRKDLRPALLVLLGAVGTVLLIACANLANLLLARATGRTRELAVRTAIGATRGRLVVQLLSESLVLSIVGGLLGVALAFWIIFGLTAWNPSNLPWIADVRLDTPVLLFAIVVSVATGIIFGTLPALYASKTDLHTGLREGGRTGADGPRGQFARRALVVGELALALTLLVAAGLLIRSFDRLLQVDPGFSPDRVVTFLVSLPEAKYPKEPNQTAFWDALLPKLQAVPGVEAVGASSTLPFSGNWSTGSLNVEGYQPPKGQPGPWGDIRIVSPGYHSAMRIRLLKGRFLTDADRDGAQQVAVVDDEMVRRYWRNQDPIGKRLTFDETTTPQVKWIQVVGVVEHTAHEGLDADRRIQLYLPYRQMPLNNLSFAVRASGDPLALVNGLRRAILSIDPDVPLFNVRTMESMMESAVGQRRLSTVLLTVFATIALLLAALGIYGVISFDVTRRTQEMGLRMALGAQRGNVLSLVMSQGMRLVLIGLVLGLGGAVAAARLIESQLFGIHATDPMTYLAVAGLLATVAVLATLVPALRATHVDPMESLRYE